MPSSRPTRRRRVERREARSARRIRRFALVSLLAAVMLIALLLTAFGGSAQTKDTFGLESSIVVNSQTKPFPQILAMHGSVRLQMPIAQGKRTAIGYHAAPEGALALTPLGRQANEGALSRAIHRIFGGGGGSPAWYRLSDGPTSALDIGAAPGTDVYAPVDGIVVGITPYIVAGKRYGSRIDIQPQSSPSLVVSLTQLKSDASLSVGSNVVSGATRIGVVVDLSRVERQALARFTNDAGNHVSLELRPATSLVLN